jgi:hypothetical protein
VHVLLWVHRLVEETQIRASSLHVLLNLIPDILVFEELVPGAVDLYTQGVVNNQGFLAWWPDVDLRLLRLALRGVLLLQSQLGDL